MDETQPITRLFAVEAERLLNEGRGLEAAQLCELGLEIFPDYPTGYAILARAYVAIGDIGFAEATLDRGLERFPLNKFLLRLKRELGFKDQQKPLPQKEIAKEDVLKDEALKDEALKENIPQEISPAATVEIEEEAEEELIIDDEIISEDDVENPEELEADPAVVEISEEAAEKEREEFEEVFAIETEDIIIDDEIISEDDVENPEELEADPAVVEISGEDAEEESEEFEEVFKSESEESELLLKDNEVLKEPEVVKEKSVVPPSANDSRYSPLRIIETFKTDEHQRKSLKSTSVRLIPGLEFAPLRFESSKKYDRHISALPEPPQFRAFKTLQRINYAAAHPSMFHRMESVPQSETSGNLIQRRAQEAGFVAQNLTPLEELATRLEKARIPVVKEDVDPQAGQFAREPSVVTDTMAKIYEMQGALAEALKAYQVLARQKPDKLEYYEGKIQEIQKRLSE